MMFKIFVLQLIIFTPLRLQQSSLYSSLNLETKVPLLLFSVVIIITLKIDTLSYRKINSYICIFHNYKSSLINSVFSNITQSI